MANVRSEFRIGLKDETRTGVASVSRSLDSLKAKAVAAGAVFGALGIGVAAAGLAAQARKVIDLGDKLDKLSIATGQSVEQLSALDFAAGQSGTSVDALAGASARLSKSILDIANGRGQEAADALRAIGLSGDELAQLDLASQIGTIGDALNKIDNPTKRAAIGVSLFGKRFKELAPLILSGEEGITKLVDRFIELDGVITKDQATKFVDLNDSIDALSVSSRSAGKALATELAPALTALFNGLATNIPKVGPAIKGLGQSFDTFLTETALKLERFNVKFEIFKAQLFNSERFRSQAEAAANSIEALEDKLAQRRNANRVGRAERSKAAQRAAVLNPAFVAGEFETEGDPEEAAKKAERAAAAAKRVADALQRESDSVRNYLQDYARDREEMFQREVEQSRDRAQALIEQFATPQEKAIKQLNEIARLVGENSDTYGRAAIEAFNELNPTIEEADDRAKKLEATFADLGATFSSAFEDAILNGEKFSDVLGGLAKDIARLLLRNTVTDPLAGALQGFFGGGGGSGIGDFFKGLFSNANGGLYKVAGSGGAERPVAFTAQPGEFVAVGRGSPTGGDIQVINVGAAPQRVERRQVNGKRQVMQFFSSTAADATSEGALLGLGIAPPLVAR